MLALVEKDPYKVDSKFLESECGNGNSLVETIERKVKIIEGAREVGDVDQIGWENMALMAAASVYGIDIHQRNCKDFRERMLEIILTHYKNAYEDRLEDRLTSFTAALKYIIDKNIIHGDGLTGLQSDGSPIILSDWNLISREEVIRKDYEMNKVVEYNKTEQSSNQLKSSQESVQEKTESKELKPSKIVAYTYGSIFSAE